MHQVHLSATPARQFAIGHSEWWRKGYLNFEINYFLEEIQMKKAYETPTAEKIAFQYKEQVAASQASCANQWTNIGDLVCDKFEIVKNFVD